MFEGRVPEGFDDLVDPAQDPAARRRHGRRASPRRSASGADRRRPPGHRAPPAGVFAQPEQPRGLTKLSLIPGISSNSARTRCATLITFIASSFWSRKRTEGRTRLQPTEQDGIQDEPRVKVTTSVAFSAVFNGGMRWSEPDRAPIAGLRKSRESIGSRQIRRQSWPLLLPGVRHKQRPCTSRLAKSTSC